MKSLVVGAAFAGLITGTAAVALASSSSNAKSLYGQDQPDAKSKTKATEKHACKGKNSCKGKGGCKTDANSCKGTNACKGKGGCATDGSKPKPPAA
jgi:hypothetical protein